MLTLRKKGISINQAILQPTMKRYSVVVVKESGVNPLTQEVTKRAEQGFQLYADSKQKAHLEAHRLCTLRFDVVTSRTFIDGEEHFDERLG